MIGGGSILPCRRKVRGDDDLDHGKRKRRHLWGQFKTGETFLDYVVT